MNKIQTIDQLVLVAKKGYHVKCPEVAYLAKWTKAESLMSFSARGLQTAISKGMVCRELQSVTDQLDLLQDCKDKIRSSGQSYGQIAEKLNITIQGVSKFMRSASSSTRTIAKYLKVIS
jgi:hypothetical protein